MLALLTCTNSQQNPFKPQDARINLVVENSLHQIDTISVTDTVGNQVRIGMSAYLPSYISLVTVTVTRGTTETDTTITFNNASAWTDTQWVDIAFYSAGTKTVTVAVTLQGAPNKTYTATITMVGKNVNHKPSLSVSGVRNIVSAQACSLSLSATDPDSGQTLTYAMIKGPQNATLTGTVFRWTSPATFTGVDSAIFIVTDNGTPAMSDTQKVMITVSSQIIAPAQVQGVMAVSKVNGYFVLSWNKVSNADSYNTFRSADTVAANFQKVGSTSDSLFGDSVKTANYYYYVVAVNTAGSSPASAIIYSGSIKTPPVIMVPTVDTTVSQGKTLSFIVTIIASAQDTVVLGATDISGAKLPDSATFTPKTGLFTWTPTVGELGLYRIVFTATDGNLVVKDTVKITVNKTDRPPVVQAQSINTGTNQAITVSMAASDPDNDPITQWQVTQKPSNGTATLADSTKGSVVYTPNAGFAGVDTFAVKAYDGTLWSQASANVIVTVSSIKVAPKIQTQPRADTTVSQGGSVAFTVGINNASPSPTFIWYQGTKGTGTMKDSSTNPLYQKTGVTAADSGNYYVIVVNSSGADTSAYAHLKVNVPPSAPMLSSPANNATGIAVSPTLTWNAVTGAVTYRVQVSTASDFSTGIVVDDSTLTAASKAMSSLANNTQYYWQVNAKNAGGTSAWSSVFSFTTVVAIPGAPVLSAPANNATGVPVSQTVSWGAVTGAATYRVQLSTASDFSTGIVADDSTLTAASKAMNSLTNSTVYYWRVNAKNAGGTSAWSTAFSFTTVVTVSGVPVNMNPANSATGVAVNPTLTWSAVTGAITYRVQVSTASDFSTGIVVDDSTLTTASKAVSSLMNNTVYYWHVNAKNAGGTSAWSTASSFTTIVAPPGVPVLSAPANNATGITVSPTLAWNAVTGAATYRIQVSTVSDFSSGMIEDDSTLTAASRAIGPLSNATKYYWRVNAKNAGGASSWASSSFTTIVKFALSITATNGTVTPNSAGSPYDSGTAVSLTPAPATGYQFTGWSGDLTGTANPGLITMNSAKSVTATFAIITYTLTVNPGTGGTVTPTSPTTVNYGAATAITATPSTGYKFVNWTVTAGTGATIASATSASTTVTLTGGNATVTANFQVLACSWTATTDFSSMNSYSFSVATNGNTVYVGTQRLGIYQSTNNGTSWADDNNTTDGTSIIGNYVYALGVFGSTTLAGVANHEQGIYHSFNNGSTWTFFSTGVDVDAFAAYGSTLYAGTSGNGVYISTDNGVTWGSDGTSTISSESVNALLVSGTTIYAATGSGVYYRTLPSSAYWYLEGTGLSGNATSLAMCGNTMFAGTSTGVYAYNNNTGIWSAVNSGLPTGASITVLTVSGNYLFAGTMANGVYLSADNGANWSGVNSGLPPSMWVSGLAVNSSTVYLVSGAHYTVFSSPLP